MIAKIGQDGHKTLVPQFIAEQEKLDRSDIMVTVGDMILAQEYQFLYDAGAVAIFGIGMMISDSAIKCISQLNILFPNNPVFNLYPCHRFKVFHIVRHHS